MKRSAKRSSFRTIPIVFFILTISFTKAFSQNTSIDLRNWGIGLNSGFALASMNVKTKALPFYGFHLRYAANPTLAITGNFDFGLFESAKGARGQYAYHFTDHYFQYYLATQTNILRLLNMNQVARKMSWYAEIGAGQVYSDVKTSINRSIPGASQYQGTNGNFLTTFVTLGSGFRFNISPRFDFDLGYHFFYTNSGYLDGYIAPHHLVNKDYYHYLQVGITLKLGKKSISDADWVRRETLIGEHLQNLSDRIDDLSREMGELHRVINNNIDSLKANRHQIAQLSDSVGELSKKVHLKRMAHGFGIDFDTSILFNFDSSHLQPQAVVLLRNLATTLRKNPEIHVIVSGYADSIGTSQYNINLSNRRAYSVADYFTSHGIQADRVMVKAFGKKEPVASNRDLSGRIENRRVVITLVEPDKQQ